MQPQVLALLLFVVPLVSQVQGRGGAKRGKNRNCGEWMLTECVPLSGTCGAGTQEATREGTCKKKHRTLDCVVPCLGQDEGENLPLTNPEPTIDIDGGPDPTEEQPTRENRKAKRKERKRKKNKNKGCRYRRDSCEECDIASNQKTCSMILKKGDASCAATKTVTRPCNKKKAKNGCKYHRPKTSGGTWSECEPVSKTKTMSVTLKKGDPDTCAPTKVLTRHCRLKRNKKACRYEKRKWEQCNSDGKKTRVDELKPGSPDTCNPTRTVEKPCKRRGKRCQYDFGTWGDCVDGKRERIATVKGASGSECAPIKTISKSCLFKDGSERCLYGPWGEFSDCHNGVRTKIRPVLVGGDRCQRRGVKTKPC